ncbi:unnamed protein product [Amoebophrya sp. A25]|nr:unnamed protein product [Amoebophrya sp. A25]|eukprot:GSA25T00018399001.1
MAFIIADDGTIIVDLRLKNNGGNSIVLQKIWEVPEFGDVLPGHLLGGATNTTSSSSENESVVLGDVVLRRLRGHRLQSRFFVAFYAASGGLSLADVVVTAVGGIVMGTIPYLVVVVIAGYLAHKERKKIQAAKQKDAAVIEAATTLNAVNAATHGQTNISDSLMQRGQRKKIKPSTSGGSMENTGDLQAIGDASPRGGSG